MTWFPKGSLIFSGQYKQHPRLLLCCRLATQCSQHAEEWWKPGSCHLPLRYNHKEWELKMAPSIDSLADSGRNRWEKLNCPPQFWPAWGDMYHLPRSIYYLIEQNVSDVVLHHYYLTGINAVLCTITNCKEAFHCKLHNATQFIQFASQKYWLFGMRFLLTKHWQDSLGKGGEYRTPS